MPTMTMLALRSALALFTLVLASPATAQLPPPAAAVTPDPWPRTVSLGGAKYALYQPQVDSWTGGRLEARSAVSVLPAGSQVPVFGVIEITAKTEVDRAARTVYFRDITVAKATFPSAPQSASQYQQGVQP